MTVEQLLAMPDDGVDRDLIRGRLREKPITRRNRLHTHAVARITHLLEMWCERQSEPRGEVHAGEVGTILRRDPDTTVGIDVAYFSAEVVDRQSDNTTIIEAVEVLSPSDKHEEVREKVLEYLDTGVPLVWIVDPYFQTVQVHRPHDAPEMFNREQTVSGGDVLPGLKIAVAEIFQRWVAHARLHTFAHSSMMLEGQSHGLDGDTNQQAWGAKFQFFDKHLKSLNN
jgi:Uma2 family endonuclease